MHDITAIHEPVTLNCVTKVSKHYLVVLLPSVGLIRAQRFSCANIAICWLEVAKE